MNLPDVDTLAPRIVTELSRSTAVERLHEEFLELSAKSGNYGDIQEFNSCNGGNLPEAAFVRAFIGDVLTSPKGGGWPKSALGLMTLECAERLQTQHLPPGASFLPPPAESAYDVPEAIARANRLRKCLPSLHETITDVLLASATVSARTVSQVVGPTIRCYRGLRPTRDGLPPQAVYPQRALSAWSTDKDFARDRATTAGRVMTVNAPAALVWILPGYGEGELILGLAPPTASQALQPPQYKWLDAAGARH